MRGEAFKHHELLETNVATEIGNMFTGTHLACLPILITSDKPHEPSSTVMCCKPLQTSGSMPQSSIPEAQLKVSVCNLISSAMEKKPLRKLSKNPWRHAKTQNPQASIAIFDYTISRCITVHHIVLYHIRSYYIISNYVILNCSITLLVCYCQLCYITQAGVRSPAFLQNPRSGDCRPCAWFWKPGGIGLRKCRVEELRAYRV